MSKKLKTGIVLILICVAIAVGALLMNRGSEFGGSDDAASDTISEILDKEYEPYISPIYEPPGSETESLLFCLQAALGAGIFGYGIGVLRTKKVLEDKVSKKDNVEV